MTEANKPTVMQVRRTAKLTTQEVTDLAGVPLRVAYLMEIGSMTDREDVQKILLALPSLTQQRYAVDDFSNLHIRQVKPSANNRLYT